MVLSPDLFLRGALIGIGGAALMDAWSLVLRRGFGVTTLDYRLLGRWIGHIPRGRLVHERIASAEPVPGERPLGWLAHYAIGVTFAFLLIAIWGPPGWTPRRSCPPWSSASGRSSPLVRHAARDGAGIAGSRSPNPRATRLRNLGTHAVYGLGLYGSALLMASFARSA